MSESSEEIVEEIAQTRYLKRSSTAPSTSSSSSQYYDESMEICCLLCCEMFNKPKTLICSHMFCESCLIDYANSNSCEICCPICAVPTIISDIGVIGLPSSDETTGHHRKISVMSDGQQRCDICIHKRMVEEAQYHCSKCFINMCANCKTNHDQQLIFRRHQCVQLGNKDILHIYCDVHYKNISSYNCIDCHTLACCLCIMTKHSGHNILKLKEAIKLKRNTIKSLMPTLSERLNDVEKCIELALGKSTSSNYSRKEGLRRQISFSPNLLTNEVNNLNKSNKLYNFAGKIVEPAQARKLLAMYHDLVARMQYVISTELYNIASKIKSSVLQPDSVFTKATASWINNSMKVKTTAELQDSKPAQQRFLHSPELIWKVEKQHADMGDLWNPCDITFLPDACTVVAEYDISNDRHNKLRIFSATGDSVSVIGQGTIKPLGVTISKEGKIYVTDCENKRVKIFDICGTLVGEIGKGSFGWPFGISINSKGQVIVSDAFNDTISIFGGDGKKIKQFGSPGTGSSHFKNPYHISVDSSDKIYVADSGNNKVKIFDCEGNYLNGISSYMSDQKKKRLRTPKSISVDKENNLLVSDDSNRVSMFTQTGLFAKNILSINDGIKFPEAISTNGDGLLAVTEWNPNQMIAVKVYKMYG